MLLRHQVASVRPAVAVHVLRVEEAAPAPVLAVAPVGEVVLAAAVVLEGVAVPVEAVESLPQSAPREGPVQLRVAVLEKAAQGGAVLVDGPGANAVSVAVPAASWSARFTS